jgi:hypothetical protein
VTGQWFSPGTPVSSTNKTECHDITEILLEVALNTIVTKIKGRYYNEIVRKMKNRIMNLEENLIKSLNHRNEVKVG